MPINRYTSRVSRWAHKSSLLKFNQKSYNPRRTQSKSLQKKNQIKKCLKSERLNSKPNQVKGKNYQTPSKNQKPETNKNTLHSLPLPSTFKRPRHCCTVGQLLLSGHCSQAGLAEASQKSSSHRSGWSSCMKALLTRDETRNTSNQLES